MKKQLTFEEIGILDENELSKISSELGDGYGGWDANQVFSKLLPEGYSLAFIERLMSGHYLCITYEENTFSKVLEEYKNSIISEWENIPCPTCKKCVKQIRRDYKRVGNKLNEKGELINKIEFRN